ncbi:MAG: hypothetical protein AAF614_20055 [Chloroflexota bacterium]
MEIAFDPAAIRARAQQTLFAISSFLPIGSWRVNLHATDAAYAETLGLLLRQGIGKRPLLPNPDLTLYLVGVPADNELFPTSLPQEEGEIAQWQTLINDVEMLFTGWFRVFAYPQQIIIVIREPQFSQRAFRDHLFATLSKLLFRANRFYIHAAAVAWQEQVSLFVAPGGFGKSTITLRLAQAGATVLSEDHVLLRRDENGRFWVSGCQETARVTAKTEKMIFAQPLDKTAVVTNQQLPKKLFDVADYFTADPYTDYPFQNIFFNHLGEQFQIQPISRQETILRLLYMTRSFFRYSETADLSHYLNFFSDLVMERNCFNLELSPNLKDLDKLIVFLNNKINA